MYANYINSQFAVQRDLSSAGEQFVNLLTFTLPVFAVIYGFADTATHTNAGV